VSDDEIIAAIESSLAMQGAGEVVIEPRVHLEPARWRRRTLQMSAPRLDRRGDRRRRRQVGG